ncbi:MAG: valine--tRNA ligase [Candidatus Promineifilaceae bacterium]|nr:valine--tRNA ligase [Candidatus Promineifilaceae bacterium]
MTLKKWYNPRTAEPHLQEQWQESDVYHFSNNSDLPIYSIDTPPPTVSGKLHLGHVYSYSHADFLARYKRMTSHNVFYPMGYDDNGLPTERLVERTLGIKAQDIGRSVFIEKCLEVSEIAEKDYRELWTRLGLSIDWRYSYRTIDSHSRRIAQLSFLDLYTKDLAYRDRAPSIWCPECQTAIAQAELNDLDREAEFHTLAFSLDSNQVLPIATTRPELLPACVAVFVHPQDARFGHLMGKRATVPYFGQKVPILADQGANPDKGTGAVMCCTFGDTADVEWWRKYKLPLVEIIDRDGRMMGAAGLLKGLPAATARQKIVDILHENQLLLNQQSISQSVRVHERCDTPVEYIVSSQWFIRVLDFKEDFLRAGDQVNWHPPHMKHRYQQWVEDLSWDWGISRQRYFGVPFPVWYCEACGATITAAHDQLPIDPLSQSPDSPCPDCGHRSFNPEQDVMDTWATSSMSPQIVGQWLKDDQMYEKLVPFSCRPQAHEIIRTWAFYTIVKSHHHFGTIPWTNAVISGWGLAPSGEEKLSKSRGGGSSPLQIIEDTSADAVRYWAASTGLGKDATIDEERIRAGSKLVTKLWNVARFSERFLSDYSPQGKNSSSDEFSPADRWILARVNSLILRCNTLWETVDYATVKSEVELFFWRDLADNYLEMAKKRLYDGLNASGARYTLYEALLTTIKLLAPILPHVTDCIYQETFSQKDGCPTIHHAIWPRADRRWIDRKALSLGSTLLEIATAVRRYKSENNLSLGAELTAIHLVTKDEELAQQLKAAHADLISLTRSEQILVGIDLRANLEEYWSNAILQIAIKR